MNGGRKNLFRLAEYCPFARTGRKGKLAARNPFARHRAEVLPAWIDYNGHMTEYRYLQVISDASDCLLNYLGLSEEYVRAGHSFYTVESHIQYLAEAKLGEKIFVHTQLLKVTDKKVHLWHSLKNDLGIEIATGEQMWLHVDIKANRCVPMLEPLLGRFVKLFEAHKELKVPIKSGRKIGEK